MTSPAREFIGNAISAKRNQRETIHRTVELAITGHFRFDVGDVAWMVRELSLYEGQPNGYYDYAIKFRNESFAKAFEADRKMAPWLWPTCLIGWSREKSKQKTDRLHLGSNVWLVVKGHAALWTVTSLDRNEIRLKIIKTEPTPPCEKCHRASGNPGRTKVVSRVRFKRPEWQAHLDRLQSIRKLGILDDGGLVVWSAKPHAGRLSHREQAWDCDIIGTWHRLEHGQAKVTQGVVLKSCGVIVHGETLRQARGCRQRKIKTFESNLQKWMSSDPYGHSATKDAGFDLDIPRRVTELKELAEYHEGFGKGSRLLRNLRGETITIRQWLEGSENVRRDAFRIGDLLRDQELLVTAAESRRREAERQAAEEQLLLASSDVLVGIADSLDIGNCALGTASWLAEFFPEVLPRTFDDGPQVGNGASAASVETQLRRINKTLTVGMILAKFDNRRMDQYLRSTLLHAIRKSQLPQPERTLVP